MSESTATPAPSTPPLVLRALAIVAGGLLLSTLVPNPWPGVWPYGWHFLHWVAYLPMFWALRSDTPRSNRWLLVLYGVAAEAAIFAWIPQTLMLFSNLGTTLSFVALVLFALVFGLPYPLTFMATHTLRRRLGDWWMVALPAWLVVIEWLSTLVILFPYPQGTTQYRFPYTWQLASVTGVWGLSFLVLFVNTTLAEWLYRRREGRPAPVRWMAAAALAVSLVLAFGVWRLSWLVPALDAAPTLRVAQLQSSKDMLQRGGMSRKDALQEWVDAVLTVEPGSVDLVVLPEGAIPYDLNASTTTWLLWDLAREGRFTIVAGAGTRERIAKKDAAADEQIRDFNSVYVFDPSHLAVDPTAPDAEAAFTALAAAGCDTTTVRLAVEARALASAGESALGDASCIATLRTLEATLRAGARLPADDEPDLSLDPDVFRALRRETARLGVPLVEQYAARRDGARTWIWRDAACEDGDCRSVALRCEAPAPDASRPCLVTPEAPHYDKMVPLPFGEYLPLASVFPILAEWIQGPGNFRAGTEAVVFDAAGVRFGTPICYEAILSYACRAFERPDLLVNVTNDAWFGPTTASDLHGMLVAARAIELGVPVVRSAYSGISFTVRPDGRIDDEAPLFTEVRRTVTVPRLRVDTLYAQWGDWFVVGCALFLAVAWNAGRGRA